MGAGFRLGFSGQLAGGLGGYTGYLTHTQTSIVCTPVAGSGGGAEPVEGPGSGSNSEGLLYSNYVYHDPYGRTHAFNYSLQNCPSTNGQTITGDGSTSDGSGFSYVSSSIATGQVHSRSGQIINAPDEADSTTSGSIIDSNGNTVTNNGNGSFTDTLGVTALTIGGAGSAASPLTFTYPVVLQANSSTSATVTIFYRTYTVQTNFQCSGISEYGPNSVDLIDHITLSDASASTYSFTYEATPGGTGAVTGRLASITLPTGGTISYSYTQGGCNGSSGINPDGTPGSMTRATSDGTRTYNRASVNANATSTTLQDEKGNQSVYQFTIADSLFFETERTIYQGGTQLFDQLG